MTLIKTFAFNVSMLAVLCCVTPLFAEDMVQQAWDNPVANMEPGSIKPGYANLAWSTGTVLPIKTRKGMATLISLPKGERITDIVLGDDSLFDIADDGDQLYVTPYSDNAGNDTNMIVTGQSGNKYIFYMFDISY